MPLRTLSADAHAQSLTRSRHPYSRIVEAAGWVIALLAVPILASAQAPQLPAAPQVTLGAELKALRFDWEPVAGAAYYQLRIRIGNSPYTALGARIPASTTHARQPCVSVHLQDWQRTRYVVEACNAAGCTASAALDPGPLMLATIGYFKASNTEADDLFGREVVLSDDGLTLAVAAPHESSIAKGVNGDQENNDLFHAGAVYIFRRRGSGWRQEAYLKPLLQYDGARFGAGIPTRNSRAVALNRDGSIAVIGAPATDANAFGFSGMVYVFTRGAGGWAHTATLSPPEPATADYFGYSIDLSLDGRTLKINSMQPQDPNVNIEGRTHIYRREGTNWRREVTLAPFYAGDFCPIVRMSGDGRTLVSSCYNTLDQFRAVTMKRVGNGWVHAGDVPLNRFTTDRPIVVNGDGTRMALSVSQPSSSSAAIRVFRYVGSAWVDEATLQMPAGLPDGTFGFTLEMNRGGNLIAVGDDISSAGGAGVSPTAVPGNAMHGAVFLYQRIATAPITWRLRSVIKAPNPGAPDMFGYSVSLSGSGKSLAVGAPLEDSAARGIDGDQTDESAPDAGAAYVY